jgi:polyhydroxyalkanoate synthesis regulator protein
MEIFKNKVGIESLGNELSVTFYPRTRKFALKGLRTIRLPDGTYSNPYIFLYQLEELLKQGRTMKVKDYPGGTDFTQETLHRILVERVRKDTEQLPVDKLYGMVLKQPQ